MIVYLIFEKSKKDPRVSVFCAPHDKLIAACSNMKAVGQTIADMDFNEELIRIEKHECEYTKAGDSIFVLLKHPEPNAPMMFETQITELRKTQFSKEEQRSKCDMAYSLESVECILNV